MKNIRVKFISTLLVLFIIAISFLVVAIYPISIQAKNYFPEFSNMQIPLFILCVLIAISVIVAIIFGMKALLLYSKGENFTYKMLSNLENCGVSFFSGVLLQVLTLIYIALNGANSILNVWIFLAIIIFLLASQIFFLLSDIIKEGIKLKEDQELTI